MIRPLLKWPPLPKQPRCNMLCHQHRLQQKGPRATHRIHQPGPLLTQPGPVGKHQGPCGNTFIQVCLMHGISIAPSVQGVARGVPVEGDVSPVEGRVEGDVGGASGGGGLGATGGGWGVMGRGMQWCDQHVVVPCVPCIQRTTCVHMLTAQPPPPHSYRASRSTSQIASLARICTYNPDVIPGQSYTLASIENVHPGGMRDAQSAASRKKSYTSLSPCSGASAR